MRTIIFALLISILTVTPAHSLTGREWLSQCKGITNIQRASCIAYIRGLDDMNSLFNQLQIYSKQDDNYNYFPKICYPKGVTFGQLKKILTKWLNENPGKLHEELNFLYIMMMRETFPCKTQ